MDSAGALQNLTTVVLAIQAQLYGLQSEFTSFRGEFSELREEIHSFRREVNDRFNKVDQELARLEIMIGEVDDKFSLITEGQDMIRDVLETRVEHIEEILGA